MLRMNLGSCSQRVLLTAAFVVAFLASVTPCLNISTTVEYSGETITYGEAVNILDGGTLLFEDCTVTFNYDVAIYDGGSLQIDGTQATFSGNAMIPEGGGVSKQAVRRSISHQTKSCGHTRSIRVKKRPSIFRARPYRARLRIGEECR